MIPVISTPFGNLSTYTIMLTIAMLTMLICLHIELRNAVSREKEELYILPKIIVSGVVAFAFSAVFDALFKIDENKGFVIRGITFYGGLIGAVVCMFFLLKLRKKHTEYTTEQWFDILTVPLIVFHFWGRIGCFLAGCCYGKTTDSILGVYFVDNVESGIIHNGAKCYPTQLFEAFALIIILLLVLLSRKRFKMYLLSYAVGRFFIEFFRGDDRGFFVFGLSPAQVISVVIVIGICLYQFYKIVLIRIQDNNTI
ncbi:MAG: prolipoprotein diacylglyceryl transferase [Ruminococcus sp.]